MKPLPSDIQRQFGPIDIYLFDQILRGRIVPGIEILDAGCGEGRNLHYFLQHEYQVFGIDQDFPAVEQLRRLSPCPENFKVESIESMSFPDAKFDLVISNAVLHFAQNDKQFKAMLLSMWRVLKPNGIFFCRLASSIGMARQMKRIKARRFLLPDGSERYLVDEAMLERFTRDLNAVLLDPIKTTVVQNQRCMTTWVLQKR